VPIRLSLSFEFGYQRWESSTDTWTLEIHPIIDRQLGPSYVSFNPTFDKSFKGESQRDGLEFAPAAKVSYVLTQKVALALEYYGAVGRLNRIDPVRDQQHLVFPVGDPGSRTSLGIQFRRRFRTHPSTDTYLIKMILGYRFGALPEKERDGARD
jgi:hypothetical protein